MELKAKDIKNSWKKQVISTIRKYSDSEVEVVFEADQINNKYFYNDLEKSKFIMGDMILKVKGKLYTFEFLTKKNTKYRFSLENKYFWEKDLKTGKVKKCKVNWPHIWKRTKDELDKYNNGLYSIFILVSWQIDYKGSKNGIYGLEIDNIESYFSNFEFK